MDFSELTQEHIKEIMLNAYKIGNSSEDIDVKELIEEIKQQIMSVLRSK
jgi:translation elongation factor EF-1beta